MAKIKNASNKKRYDRYKQENRRGLNKQKKAERHKKRMERFAKRKEEGKNYVYQKNPDANWQDKDRQMEAIITQNKKDSRLPLQRWDSIWRKLCNRINKEIAAEKAKAILKKKNDQPFMPSFERRGHKKKYEQLKKRRQNVSM